MDRKAPFDIMAQLGSLRRYARALTRNDADVEDLVQDALLRAHERRDSFRKGADLRLWLMSILHNAFIDSYRARRAEQRRESAAARLAPRSMAATQDDVVRLAQIRAAFFRLPDDQRAALHLVAIEGMSYPEAAAILGVPQGTLMSRIARARAALRAFEEGGPHLKLVGGRDDADG